MPTAPPSPSMKIREVLALPVSMPLPEGWRLTAGPFTFSGARSTVLVRIETVDGLVGWGEAMSAGSPRAIARLVNGSIAPLLAGADAAGVAALWTRMYERLLRTSGADAAAAIAMSGVDMALWDLRGKAVGWPLYRLLGGEARGIRSYAGGLSLGYQPAESLVDEALGLVARGHRALKLRGGDTPARDLERATAVRRALPDHVELMIDANTRYSLDDARIAMPRLAELGMRWLEEPFAPQQRAAYQRARAFGTLPLAAGENHFLRWDFQTMLDDGAVSHLQPDLSKCGGITEALRIAAAASSHHVPISPHSATTALNYAAGIHLLAAIDNAGWFEADAASANPLHHDACSSPYSLDADGLVWPLERPGIGVDVDEPMIRAHLLPD